MKRFMPLLWIGLGFWSGAAVAQTFVTLDYPGVVNTQLVGIDGSNIVGTAFNSTGGFLYNGSTFTDIGDPLVNTSNFEAGTWPSGISGNNIVGYYLLGSVASVGTDSTYHGFLYNGSTYTTLDDPQANTDGTKNMWGTIPCGISGNNIVGGYGVSYYTFVSGYGPYYYNVFYGFLYNGSTYTTLRDPNAGSGTSGFQGTWARGIQGNEIVGSYEDSSQQDHGFVYNMQTRAYTTLDDPLASGSWGTIAEGISGNTIFGVYYTTNGVNGFLYDMPSQTFTTLDDPSTAADTFITGMSGNTVIGWYEDSSGYTHGFTATVPEPSTLVLLSAGVLALAAYAWRKRSLALAAESTLPSETDSHAGPVIVSMPSRWTQSTRRAA